MSPAKAIAGLTSIIANADHAKFFTGAMPATTAAADSGTLLLEITSLVFAAPSSGTDEATSDLTSADDGVGDAGAGGGTAGHCRIYDSGGTVLWQDDDIGVSLSGSNVELSDITIDAGVTYTVVSWTLRLPEVA